MYIEVWFSIQITWKISLETNQNPGKLEFTDLSHGSLVFQGRLGILHPPPEWISNEIAQCV